MELNHLPQLYKNRALTDELLEESQGQIHPFSGPLGGAKKNELVPVTGIEPVFPYWEGDFKSPASACFAIPACIFVFILISI